MRTGNSIFSITFQRPGESEVRLTLLDDGVDGIAELVDAGAPWEESAAVPVDQMSRFRVEAEALPETWAPVTPQGPVRLEVRIESDGRTSGFVAQVPDGGALPDAHRWLVELVAGTIGAALLGARSSRAVVGLRNWLSATPADG